MAKISGILTDGAGQIINDCIIELYAKKTTSEVLMQTHAFIVANDGRYSIDVLPCDYEVSLIINGFPKKRLGTIKVYSNSGDGTLNDYLTDPNETEINSEFIQQVIDARNEAGKSAKAAKQSEINAVNTLNNVVKKTGDTITTLTITDPIALCLKGSNKEISTLFHYDGTSFEILFNKGSDPNGLKAIQINSKTGDVNFNHNVTINNKTVFKKDDKLVINGATSTDNIAISKNTPEIVLTDTRNQNTATIFSNDSYLGISTSDPDFKKKAVRLNYSISTKVWNFENVNNVAINGKSIIKQGDHGVGGLAIRDAGDGSYPKGCQFISIPRGAVGSPLSTSTLIGLHVVNHSEWGLQIIGQDGVKNPKVFVRTIGSGDFVGTAEFITSANSTVDSNGFLKAASPILRLFASDDVNPDDGFIKAGFAHVNDEAKNAYAKKIAVGHYEIHGSLGFAKEGWYITLPEDANGNKKFFADYSVDENNIITIKTYTKKFDTNRCEIVAGDPIDITEGRWIDVRLDMMVNDPPYKQSGE